RMVSGAYLRRCWSSVSSAGIGSLPMSWLAQFRLALLRRVKSSSGRAPPMIPCPAPIGSPRSEREWSTHCQAEPGQTVGEMAATQPLQPRSATVVAAEPSVVARLDQARLTYLGDKYPAIWRFFAKDLASRLL